MRVAILLASFSLLLLWSCGSGGGDPDQPDGGVPVIAFDLCGPPPDCDDGDPCTDDEVRSNGECTYECENTPRCEDGDGCCGAGCGATEDNDCDPECGNGLVEAGEVCDGDCPATPTDCENDGCAIQRIRGSAENCDAACVDVTVPEDRCIHGDGCCPERCSREYDDDCEVPAGTFGDSCVDVHQCGAPEGSEPRCFWAGWQPDPSPTQCTYTCDDDSDCATAGAACVGGACAQLCSSDAACPDGWYCGQVSAEQRPRCLYEPWHARAAPVGSACSEHHDCLGANPYHPGLCLGEDNWGFEDGYCSWGWGCVGNDHPSCRDDDVCISELCWESCDTDADCRTGYACYDYFGANIDICAPVGGDRIGDACTEHADCRGGRFAAWCVHQDAGGYCTTACRNDGECAGDAFCSETSVCRTPCTSDVDCRSGFGCAADRSGRATCLPIGEGSAELGEACEDAASCNGYGRPTGCLAGALAPTGYCVIYGCSTDDDCPGVGVCTDNTCYAGCPAGDECPPNTVCASDDGVTSCTVGGDGAGGVGDVCSEHDDCDGICLNTRHHFEGMCSQICNSGADCPAGTHCIANAVTSGVGACYETCTNRGDSCDRDDFACRSFDASGLLECAPFGLTQAPVGSPCTGAWECSGLDALCHTGFENGYCMGSCNTDSDCASGGVCLESEGAGRLCWEQCSSNLDCRPPQYCTEVLGGVSICL